MAVVLKLLEDLLVGKGPFGRWPEEHLGEWLNDVHVTQFEEVQIALYSYVSLTKEVTPRLETRDHASGEIDNSMFSIQFPRSGVHRKDEGFPEAYPTGMLYDETEFPPVLQHHQDDHHHRVFCCQVPAIPPFLQVLLIA